MKKKLLTIPLFFLLFTLGACSGPEASNGMDTKNETSANPAATEAAKPENTGGQAEATENFALPGTNIFPEGVAYQESTGNFFVSGTTDGTIFRATSEKARRPKSFSKAGRTAGRAPSV